MLLPSKYTTEKPTGQTAVKPNAARRQLLLRSISLLAIPALVTFALVMFFRGNWCHGLLNLGVALLVALGLIYLPRCGRAQLVLCSISALIGLRLIYDMEMLGHAVQKALAGASCATKAEAGGRAA